MKKHGEKDKTIIIIIDNRTSSFSKNDYLNAYKKLYEILQCFQFLEIWFYTGYYSDLDGSNAEFSFSPLKITDTQTKILNNLTTHNDIHIW